MVKKIVNILFAVTLIVSNVQIKDNVALFDFEVNGNKHKGLQYEFMMDMVADALEKEFLK